MTLLDKLGAREKVGLSVAALCVGLVLLDLLVVSPLWRHFGELDERIEDAERGVRFNNRVLNWKTEITAEYEQVRGALGTVTSAARASDLFNAEVDALARKAGIECPLMGPRSPRESDFYQEYLVEVGKYEGPIDNLLAFLHAVRTAPGLMRVARLSVAPSKREGAVQGSMVLTKVMARPPSATVPE